MLDSLFLANNRALNVEDLFSRQEPPGMKDNFTYGLNKYLLFFILLYNIIHFNYVFVLHNIKSLVFPNKFS